MTRRIGDLTLSEAWVRVRRYRPLALTVVVTLGALRLAPGPEPRAAELVAAPVPGAPLGQAVAPQTTAAPDPTGREGILAVPSPAPRASIAPPRAQPPAAAPPRTSPPAPAPAPDDVDEPERPEDVVVGGAGWASTDPGTPVADAGVPADGLPISNRLGQLSKASFLRLEGPWASLALDVHPEGTTFGLGDVVLQACAITTADWTPGPAQSFDEAPEWGDRCVVGDAGEGGWTFAVADIDHPHGVAIVPTVEAALDFQVVLRDPRPGPGAS